MDLINVPISKLAFGTNYSFEESLEISLLIRELNELNYSRELIEISDLLLEKKSDSEFEQFEGTPFATDKPVLVYADLTREVSRIEVGDVVQKFTIEENLRMILSDLNVRFPVTNFGKIFPFAYTINVLINQYASKGLIGLSDKI